MRVPFATTGLILLLAGGLASACGSSNSPTASAGSGSTPTTASTATATTAAGSGGSACQQYASYQAQAAQISAAFGQPGANELTILKQAISTAATALDNADGSAPSQIAAAIHTLRTTFDQVNSNFQALGSTASSQQIQAAVAPLSGSGVKAAGDQVTAYIRSSC